MSDEIHYDRDVQKREQAERDARTPNHQSKAAAPAGSVRKWTDEEVEWLLQEMELHAKLKEADNRKLLWLAMNTKPWKSPDVGSIEADIFTEIENRLYPEYDGETVTFELWGWRTPDGEIRYLPNEKGQR